MFGVYTLMDTSSQRPARYTDVLSVALSVYKIVRGKDSHGVDCFYIVLSSDNPQYVFDVARVLVANGIVGTLCRTPVLNKDKKTRKMLALCVRDENQEFICDVEKTMADVTYFRDVVLPRYTTAQKNK